MPIYQSNIWICEICGSIKTATEQTHPYSDPVVESPSKEVWSYVIYNNKEVLACPVCILKHE